MKDKRYLSPSVKGMKTGIMLFGLILVQLLVFQPVAAVSPSFFGWNQAHMPLNNTDDIAYGDYLFLYDNTQLYPGESVYARDWTVRSLDDASFAYTIKNVTNPVFGPINYNGTIITNLTVTDGALTQYPNVTRIYHVNDGRKWIQPNYTYDLDSKALPYGTITFHDASIAKLFPEVKVTNWWWNVTNSSGYSYYSTADSITPGDYEPFNERYTINLTVNNSEQNNMASVSGTLNVPAVSDGPQAWFDAVPRSGSAPLTVDFIDQSSGYRPFKYNWNFGDGLPNDNNASPTHVFTKADNYTVLLVVTDALNRESNRAERIEFITVEEPQPPVVDFTASPVVGPAPLEVSFLSLSTGTDSTTKYNWTFGEESSGWKSEKYINHTFKRPGSYDVALNVTNVGGFKKFVQSDMITVTDDLGGLNVTPVPQSGYVPLDVSFIVQSSGPTLTNYTWDFGDGKTGTGYPMQHRYMNPGTYPVSLRVNDTYGSEATAGTTVTVSGSGDLVASFDSRSHPELGQYIVEFTDTSKGNPDSWFWQFGDGYVDTDRNPNHTYIGPGSYPVTLTAKSGFLRDSYVGEIYIQ